MINASASWACLFAALISCSCRQAEIPIDKQFENQRLSSALLNAGKSAEKKIRLTEVAGIDPAAVVCVLEPYRESLEPQQQLADQINRQLKAASFVADEDYWVIVQYNAQKPLQVSVIQQTQRRLKGAEPHGKKKEKDDPALCGPAASFVVDVTDMNQIGFQIEAERK